MLEEKQKGTSGILRFPRGTLGPHTDNKPNQVNICDSSVADEPYTKLWIKRDYSVDGF